MVSKNLANSRTLFLPLAFVATKLLLPRAVDDEARSVDEEGNCAVVDESRAIDDEARAVDEEGTCAVVDETRAVDDEARAVDEALGAAM